MKLLFFQWNSFMNQGIEAALHKLQMEYETFMYQFIDWEKDDVFLEKFKKRLHQDAYDVVFSVNFSPLISQICEECGVRYVAWVYDSPIHIRDLSALKRSCNEVYFFDRGQAEVYRTLGIDARYMPLAVDVKMLQNVIAHGKKQTYKTDVSMVGQLYQTEYNYFTAPLDGYLKGYLEGVINSQMKVYGGYLIPELITPELLERMNVVYKKVAVDGFQMGRRELEYMLAQEVTGRERYMALALLSSRYGVDFYSNDNDERLSNVNFRGYADYNKVMPLVFAQSRINLNISLRTIRTGIPLRILDIMGAGGFVLTNYQEEVQEYFKIGEECEVYDNLEDMVLKADFYLHNEEIRQSIASAAYERVRRDFTFEDRLKKMLLE